MRILMMVVACGLLLAACASESTDPADVVEGYLEAKVAGDSRAMQQLLCSPMEVDLQREAAAFTSVTDVSIEDMACTSTEGSDIVQCTGQIVANYGAEDTSFPLSSYRVVQEDGEWKWCGEAS